MDARTRAVKMDKFHMSRRVQEAAPQVLAVAAIAKVTRGQVVAEVLRHAIPYWSQLMIGKIELSGHPMYDTVSNWRCVYHGASDYEQV